MRHRIDLWKRIFDTDDNAISKGLSKLAWDLTAFTCVVEMVRKAPDTEGGKRLNGMILEMLVSGFWSSTMQGVRRLAERETIHGARGVCSIRARSRPAETRRKSGESETAAAFAAACAADALASRSRTTRSKKV